MADINKIEENRLRILKEIEKIEDKLQKYEKFRSKLSKTQLENEEKAKKKREENLKQLERIETAITRITKEQETQNNIIEESADLYKSIRSEIKSSISSINALDSVTSKVRENTRKFEISFAAAIKTSEKLGNPASLSFIQDLGNAFTDFSNAAESGDVSSFGADFLDELQKRLKDLPKEMQQFAGQALVSLGEMTAQIQINQGLSEDELDVYKDLTKDATELEERLKGFGTQLGLMLKKPSLSIGLMVVGLGNVVGKLGQMSKDFGVSLFQSDGIARNAAVMSLLFDDAAETAKELSSQFGSTEAASFGTQLNTNLLAMNLGISGKEAATLLGSFARLNGNSTSLANDLIVSTREFAKQNGVIPSVVMADLASNTEAFALYGKEGGINIAQAAVYAAKLGVGMDKLTGIADNLLDFETSITKELELGALLGKNINLNEARRLFYAGEMEEATAETLRQLGGIDGFNRMDYFQKKASAELLGVSVGELQQMVQNQEKANEKAGFFSETYSLLNESATALGNTLSGPFLSTLGSGIVLIGQMGTGLGAINDATGGMVSKSAEFVKNLIKAGASKIFGMFGGEKAKDVLASETTGKLGSITDSITKTESDGGKVGEGAQKSDSGLKSLAEGLKAMGSTKVLAGALNLIPTALGLVAMVAGIPSLLAIAGVGKPAGAGLEALATGLQSLGEAGLAALKGIALLGLFGVSLIPLTYALSLLAPLVESIGTAIGTMIESIGTGIATIVTSIGDLFVKILPLLNLEAALGILAIASAFTLLAGSLLAFSVAGLVALPAMLAVGTFAGLGLIGGGGDEAGGGTGDAKMDELITEIRGLRSDLSSGKIGVNMDGKKVTAAVSRVVDKVGTNSYGLG